MQKKKPNTYRSLAMAFALLILGCAAASAQKVAVKSNLLYDALLSPTVGVEVGVAPKWTVDLSGTINAWAINDHRWKQWMV